MRSQVVIPLIALVLAGQFCCCSTIIGGPQPPYVITPSDEAVQRFQDRWSTVVDESLDGSFTITLTEEELTSVAMQMLARQVNSPPINDLQIHLRNERIQVYATVTLQDSLPLPGMIAFSARATDGGISISVEEAAFGPLPIPDSILEASTDALNDLISKSVEAEIENASITDIQIGDAEMIITGTISPTPP
jgi:uncharacterized protein YpmS